MNNKRLSLGIFIIILVISMIIWSVIEFANEELIDTGNRIPCLDNRNFEFEDEMCYEKILCTNFDFSLSLVFDVIEHCDDVGGEK